MPLLINYIEFASPRIEKSKEFFADAFGWTFQDYGPTYQAMDNAGIDGGIDGSAAQAGAPPLVILKTDDLGAAQSAIEKAGGTIVRATYEFPGGRRFHFREPGGNEMAVWSET